MTEQPKKLLPADAAEAHIATGVKMLWQAADAPWWRRRKLCRLAGGHFDAARTIAAVDAVAMQRAHVEIGRQMQRDMKGATAGMTDLLSRAMPGMGDPEL